MRKSTSHGSGLVNRWSAGQNWQKDVERVASELRVRKKLERREHAVEFGCDVCRRDLIESALAAKIVLSWPGNLFESDAISGKQFGLEIVLQPRSPIAAEIDDRVQFASYPRVGAILASQLLLTRLAERARGRDGIHSGCTQPYDQRA